MSLLTRKERSLWGLIVFAFPQESSCISFAKMVFDNITIQSGFTITMVVWSGGPLTPAGTKVFDGASNRSPSTCLKPPQDYSKEGRLKPFFANNVDIPFARAKRLKPCPRKATVRSGKHMHLLRSLYFVSITTTFFDRASNCKMFPMGSVS